MIERDKEYYNKKIGELYAVIENQEKIIRDLQEESKQLKSVNSISKRTLYKMNKDRLDANLKLQGRIDKAIEYLEGCGIDKEMMEVCQNYDINGIEMMKILKGGKDE